MQVITELDFPTIDLTDRKVRKDIVIPQLAKWPQYLKDRVEGVLITNPEIQRRNRILARYLDTFYVGRFPTGVAVLNGASEFATDVMGMMTIPIQADSIAWSSYVGNRKLPKARLTKRLSRSAKGIDLVVFEDVVDKGGTLVDTIEVCRKEKARSLLFVSLMSKNGTRDPGLEHVQAGLVLYETGPRWVSGYGLDTEEKIKEQDGRVVQLYRNLDCVVEMKQEK